MLLKDPKNVSSGALRMSSFHYSSAASCCHLLGLNDAVPWPDVSVLGSENSRSVADMTVASVRR